MIETVPNSIVEVFDTQLYASPASLLNDACLSFMQHNPLADDLIRKLKVCVCASLCLCVHYCVSLSVSVHHCVCITVCLCVCASLCVSVASTSEAAAEDPSPDLV